jgi:hypothetical protein
VAWVRQLSLAEMSACEEWLRAIEQGVIACAGGA